jgi:hypothetical protein
MRQSVKMTNDWLCRSRSHSSQDGSSLACFQPHPGNIRYGGRHVEMIDGVKEFVPVRTRHYHAVLAQGVALKPPATFERCPEERYALLDLLVVISVFEPACKPDSVRIVGAGLAPAPTTLCDHLSRPVHCCRALAAYLRISGTPHLRNLALLPVGFAEPPHLCGAGELLPRHFTIARCRAVSFCCTFRRIAAPGR